MAHKLSPEEKYAKQLLASREWKKRNKERMQLYQKLWKEAHIGYSKEKSKEWRSKNPEKRKEHFISFKEKNPKYYQDKHLKGSYGISIQDYETMLHNQNGLCAICRTHYESVSRKRLFVDHNHKTGKIRALLCHKCNAAIGMANEDTDILFAMVSYLNEHS